MTEGEKGRRGEGENALSPTPRLPWLKPRSLRVQLALWYGGLLALTLLVLAGFTYLLLREFFNSPAHSNLERDAEVVSRDIAGTLYKFQTENPGKEFSKEAEQQFVNNSDI